MTALVLDLLRSRRMMIFGVCVGLLFVSIGYLALYPSLEDQLATMAEDLPDAYKAFLGDADIASPAGYIRSQVYSLMAPLLIAGAAITAGASLAKMERDQTLAVIAVTPLSRRALAIGWWSFVVAVAAIASGAVVVGVSVGVPLAGADVGLGNIIAATIPLWFFGVFAGSVALVVSAITGAPGVATSSGWLAVAVGFIANSMAELIDSVSWLASISPWSWHGIGGGITGDTDVSGVVLLSVASLALGGASVWRFERRDLHF